MRRAGFAQRAGNVGAYRQRHLTPLDANGGLPRIGAEVKALQFRKQGQWKITGIVSWPQSAAKSRSQFSFVLVRKPAPLQIAANPKFRVDDRSVFPPDIPVREIGSESGIQSLAAWFDPVSNTADGTTPRLTFESVPVAAGGLARLTPQTSGGFPLGPSMSKITLSAPELAAPVVVTVEILNRLPIFWLLIVLLLGVLFSLLFRGLLAARISLDGSRLAAAS
jgi:hypothetical protein